MPKRIPHKELEVITGEKKTEDYLKMQKMMGRFYFKDFFAKFNQIQNQGRFLEIGPGPGYQTTLIAEKYKPTELIGLEYSQDMIKVADNYCSEKGMTKTIKYVNGAVEDTALLKSFGKFDVIYSTFSLHHWTNPILGLENLYDALNEKGTLFIYDFFRGGLFYYINIKRGIWKSIRASYRPDEINQILLELKITNFFIRRKGLYMDLLVKKN